MTVRMGLQTKTDHSITAAKPPWFALIRPQQTSKESTTPIQLHHHRQWLPLDPLQPDRVQRPPRMEVVAPKRSRQPPPSAEQKQNKHQAKLDLSVCLRLLSALPCKGKLPEQFPRRMQLLQVKRRPPITKQTVMMVENSNQARRSNAKTRSKTLRLLPLPPRPRILPLLPKPQIHWLRLLLPQPGFLLLILLLQPTFQLPELSTKKDSAPRWVLWRNTSSNT